VICDGLGQLMLPKPRAPMVKIFHSQRLRKATDSDGTLHLWRAMALLDPPSRLPKRVRRASWNTVVCEQRNGGEVDGEGGVQVELKITDTMLSWKAVRDG